MDGKRRKEGDRHCVGLHHNFPEKLTKNLALKIHHLIMSDYLGGRYRFNPFFLVTNAGSSPDFLS